MALLPIPLVGPTYTNRSLPVGSQVTSNFYVEVNPQSGEPVSLMPFPGLALFSSTESGADRGMGTYNGELYKVSGTTLYKIDSFGASTSIGTIIGTERCVLTDDGLNLVITTGETKPYSYDGTTLTLGTNAYLTTSKTSAFINKRVVYDGDNGNLIFPNLNDPLSVRFENVLEAQSDPDNTLGVWSFKQQIFAAGERTIQPYWNSGAGDPPYDPVINATQQIGVNAVYSIAVNKDHAYFLGSDLNVYQYNGLSASPIGNPAICQEIRKYAVTSDAFGVAFSFDSMNFYMLSFPTGNATWLYCEDSGLWTNLAYGTDYSQHLISDYQFVYGKHLVSDRRNGNVYEMDFETYTDYDDTIHRQRDTINISGETFGEPGKRVEMSYMVLVVEPGTSLVSGQAKMVMEYSDNHGRTWHSQWADVGPQGDYEYALRWDSFPTFRNRQFRFAMTDPIKWVLVKLFAEVEIAID